ncbi:MAG: hypothetical protein LUB61_06185, partial [Eggerthellaceae bacterium]|nr:hypothetical protein [Eggerthellaceae bacterium]
MDKPFENTPGSSLDTGASSADSFENVWECSNIAISLDSMIPGNEKLLKKELASRLGVANKDIEEFSVTRKSVDARHSGDVHFVVSARIKLNPSSALNPKKGINVKPYQPK